MPLLLRRIRGWLLRVAKKPLKLLANRYPPGFLAGFIFSSIFLTKASKNCDIIICVRSRPRRPEPPRSMMRVQLIGIAVDIALVIGFGMTVPENSASLLIRGSSPNHALLRDDFRAEAGQRPHRMGIDRNCRRPAAFRRRRLRTGCAVKCPHASMEVILGRWIRLSFFWDPVG